MAWTTWLPAISLLLAPLGIMAIVWVTRRLVPTAAGSGIPQVLAVLHHADDDLRKRMLSLHVGLLKPVLTVIALLCGRSEEHTSELQSLMRSSYAVLCLNKKKQHYRNITNT